MTRSWSRQSITAGLAIFALILAGGAGAGSAAAARESSPSAPAPGNDVHYWRDRSGTVVGISRNGQLVHFEIPPFGNIVGGLTGYYLARAENIEPCATDYDLFGLSSGFGRIGYGASVRGAPYPGTLVGSAVSIRSIMRTSDGRVRLTNVWRWRPNTLALELRQFWKNLSAQHYEQFHPKIVIDVNVAGETMNNFSRTLASVSAWVDLGLSATFASEDGEPLNADVYQANPSVFMGCGYRSGQLDFVVTNPRAWYGNGALGINSWDWGLPPFKSTTRRFSFRAVR